MNRIWKIVGALTVATACVLAGSAAAQTYPNRPLVLIYPYAAGSSADIIVRAMSVEAAKTLGQPIVVETRAGATGRLGIQALKNAPGDGYILSMIASGNAVSLPLTDAEFRVEPGKDYTPVLAMYLGPFLVAVNSTLPVKDTKSLMAYAKTNSSKFNAGIVGIGAAGHIGTVFLGEAAGTEITVINYKGEGELVPAMLANEVQMSLVSSFVKPHLDSGRVIALATTSAQRMAQFPSLPTVAEVGLPKLTNLGFWVGIAAAPGLPRDMLTKLHAAYAGALKQPDQIKRIVDYSYVILGGSPEDFTNLIKSDLDRQRPVVEKLGVKLK